MAPSAPVLVTGATGFIGAEIVRQALDAGYRARLAVRRSEQIDEAKARYPGHAADALEFVVVPDLSDSAALQKALAGVESVLHVASPMPSPGKDFQTGYVEPAVKSTAALLDAAEKVSSVKRVVITASILSVSPLDFSQRPGLVIEEGQNRAIEIDADAVDPKNEVLKYHISKVLAHRATLDWLEQHKPAFDVVTIHPVFVIGHDLVQTSASEPRGVNGFFLGSLQSKAPHITANIVDVRDVAAAEVAALKAPVSVLNSAQDKTKVTELLLGGAATTWEEITAVVREKYPAFPLNLPVGPYPAPLKTDTTRVERDFGIKWHKTADVVSSVLDQSFVKA